MNKVRRQTFLIPSPSLLMKIVMGLGCLLTMSVSLCLGQETIRSQDRVAWLGGQLWESAQDYGWLEAELQTRLASQRPSLNNVDFRNVAWSGDDVEGRARAVFGGVEEGYQRRMVDLRAAKPTLVFIAYGTSEAMDDRWTVERFQNGLVRLIDDIRKMPARMVLLAPPDLASDSPFPQAWTALVNTRLHQYRARLTDLGAKEGIPVLSLPTLRREWTEDGIHLNEQGQRNWAQEVAAILVPQAEVASSKLNKIALDVKGKDDIAGEDWRLKTAGEGTTKGWAWEEIVEKWTEAAGNSESRRRVVIRGLDQGRYRLMIDGEATGAGTAEEWQAGVLVDAIGIDQQRERLRKTIVEKDTAFFHRYRPQNETYLFLFRKHEQGNNAGEIMQFDQLAEQTDMRIHSLLAPKSARWELQRED